MADQKRWFKLWESATSDDKLIALPPALRWAWAALGAHTKVHGDNGKVTVSKQNSVLAAKMGINECDLVDVIKQLPNIVVDVSNPDNGSFTVTFLKWTKYQEDSTGYERLKKYRKTHRDNGDKRRGEEKRRDPPIVPQKGDDYAADFLEFWSCYPRKIGKGAAWAAWKRAHLGNGTLQTVLDAVARAKKSEQWVKDNGQFIPHPATWLNQRRWEDEVAIEEPRGPFKWTQP